MKPVHKMEAGGSFAAAVFLGVLLSASPALAYVGPGAGLTAIGSVIALFAAVGLAIVGFLWYPIKRLRRRRRGADRKPGEKPAEKRAA